MPDLGARPKSASKVVISTGVRSRFRRFEDISVGTEKISSRFAQALELVVPLVQIISRNFVLAPNESPNTLRQSLAVAIIIILQIEDRKDGCTVKSKSCID